MSSGPAWRVRVTNFCLALSKGILGGTDASTTGTLICPGLGAWDESNNGSKISWTFSRMASASNGEQLRPMSISFMNILS